MEIWRVPGKGGRYVVVHAILFVPPRSFVRFLEKQSPKLVLAHKTPRHTLTLSRLTPLLSDVRSDGTVPSLSC